MKRYLYFAVALLLATACYNDTITCPAPKEQPSEAIIPDDVIKGEVIIKFHPEMESILEEHITRSGGDATRSGIPSTDEVLEILGAYHFERLFPIDPRHEERTRKDGLHLWYIVEFDENIDLSRAVKELSKLGEVDKIQCNRRIYRAYNENIEPHFISCAEANQATTRATTMPFNDPEMYRQW